MDEKDKKILMRAVVSGTLEDVKDAFRNHFNSQDKSYFDYKLLQAALKRNNKSITHHLVYKTTCRARNPTKVAAEETPLHLAMKLDNPHITKKLLDKGALVFHKDQNGDIPLLAGFKKKKLAAVQGLLTYYNPISYRSDNEDAITKHFHIACITNHNAAKRYLKCESLNINSSFDLDCEKYSGFNPVQFAAEKNYYPLFQELVIHGADLSLKNSAGLTPLHTIYYTCSTKTTKGRIKQIFDLTENQTRFINAVDSNGLSHLHLCCILNKPNLVQSCIDNGANVNISISTNCKNVPGFTPLHFAVTNACDKVVELLLKNGADCNKKDKQGRTPLHLACQLTLVGYWKKVHIITSLLDYEANPAVTDNQGYTPIHMEFCYAIYENRRHILDMLLTKVSEKINYTNKEGLSHFHIACATNNISLIKDFLDSGVSVNSFVPSGIYSGYTPLHFAALHNQKDVVELLLEKNAQVNVKTKEFRVTPLHLACEFNYAKFHEEDHSKKIYNSEIFPLNLYSTSNCTNQLGIVSLLLLHGADVNAEDVQGITPVLHTCWIDKNYCKLSWVCTRCKYNELVLEEVTIRIKKLIDTLFCNKAQLNIYSNKNESILHVISQYNSLVNIEELIEFILNEGADVDATDDSGLTPLHVAVKANNLRMVEKLLEHKANVNIKCKNSKIPLHNLFSDYSESSIYWNNSQGMDDSNKKKIFSKLLEKGSDVNIQVGKLNTILLHVAVFNRDIYMTEKLLCYGADISLEDSSGRSCIFPLLLWKKDNPNISNMQNDLLQTKFAQIFQMIFIHMQKLLALGLDVSSKVLKICFELRAKHTAVLLHSRHNVYNKLINLDNIFVDCRIELEKLKLTKIDNYTSLYNILLKDEHKLTKYIKKDKFVKIIEDQNANNDFPFYIELLKLQLRRGSMRITLLPIARETIFSLITKFSINLPDLCCDMITRNLKYEDLANLKAALPKRSLKRKLNDTEPLLSKSKKKKIEE